MKAVASLQRQKFATPNGDAGQLEILVIDNASSPGDVACLEDLPTEVILVKNEHNVGFASANNQGIERASGRYLCFLNPDTRVLDGALDTLLQYLYTHPGVGAVGPRFWIDDERTLLLPPGDPPTLAFLLGQAVGGAFPTWGGWHARKWHRSALMLWRSRTPVAVPMLPGACIVTPRGVVDRTGGFDPRYFLYYEDADWCRRVRGVGYQLTVIPDAEVVHYYNQSAQLDPSRTQGHALLSQARFVRSHYGWLGLCLYRVARAIGRRVARRRRPISARQVIDLGHLTTPPRLSVTGDVLPRERMIEIGYDYRGVPSAAAFVHDATLQFPDSVWEQMQSGRYYARMVDPETLRLVAVWSWEKE